MLYIENWRDLIYPLLPEECNHYEISSYGNLRNKNTGRILKPSMVKSGYYTVRVCLHNRNEKLHIIIHRAVAYTFIPNPLNYPEVNHIDGNKINNSVINLEWCTSSRNQKHKYDAGLFDIEKISGENNHEAKLSWEDVRYIREHCIVGTKEFGIKRMAKKFGVSAPVISRVVHYNGWIEQNASERERP